MFGHAGKCDIPQVTVASFLNMTVDKIKPDFILYLGDNPAHNTWQQEKKDHLTALKEVSRAFQARFNGLVYPVLGNHEGYPCDQFDTEETRGHQWLLNETAEVWSPWLTAESKATYISNGCYSQLHPDTKLRIVALNPYVSLADNRYTWGNQTDPMGVVRIYE